MDKLQHTKDSEIELIKCIEEGNIDGNEYEDFTFIHDNKIETYQIKYKSKKESLTKDGDFIKAFIPYFDDRYENINIDTVFYIVSK